VPFVAVGAASYSLFLWHYPVIEWLREQGLTVDGGWGALAFNFVLVAIVAGGLSALTYRYVESTALQHKRRGRTPTTAPEPPLRPAPAGAAALAPASD
jgi:peptidoglycan/LPS O-acetylase OafA/YrhL